MLSELVKQQLLLGKFMLNYVAFLRAINVSNRYIKMPVLAEHFRLIGYQEVKTFINTGNVLFHSSSRSSQQLVEHIEINIEPLLGFKSEVFVRDRIAIHSILATAAELSPKIAQNGEINIAFLSTPLTKEQELSLSLLNSSLDEFLVIGTEVYWICHTAQSESKFSNSVFERKLKLRSTFRRVNMLEKLLIAFE
jgi:uncharacterized protein (DUF1697 family)